MRMKAPKGYSYLTEDFNTKYKRIMLVHHADYVFEDGQEVSEKVNLSKVVLPKTDN